MINFDDYTNKNKTEQNLKWPYIPDHPDRILIHISYPDPYEAKCQYLIKKSEKVGLDHFSDPKGFMEYSNDMLDASKNIEDYNPDKKRKVLIVFDDMVVDMINN